MPMSGVESVRLRLISSMRERPATAASTSVVLSHGGVAASRPVEPAGLSNERNSFSHATRRALRVRATGRDRRRGEGRGRATGRERGRGRDG